MKLLRREPFIISEATEKSLHSFTFTKSTFLHVHSDHMYFLTICTFAEIDIGIAQGSASYNITTYTYGNYTTWRTIHRFMHLLIIIYLLNYSLIPRPLPDFQCCRQKIGRAWYSKSRAWHTLGITKSYELQKSNCLFWVKNGSFFLRTTRMIVNLVTINVALSLTCCKHELSELCCHLTRPHVIKMFLPSC